MPAGDDGGKTRQRKNRPRNKASAKREATAERKDPAKSISLDRTDKKEKKKRVEGKPRARGWGTNFVLSP